MGESLRKGDGRGLVDGETPLHDTVRCCEHEDVSTRVVEHEKLTVMDEKRDSRVGDDVRNLSRGGIGCHDNNRGRAVRGGGKISVVHKGDMRDIVAAGGKVKLFAIQLSVWHDAWLDSGGGAVTYEAGILKTLDHLRWEGGDILLVAVAFGSLVVQWNFVHRCSSWSRYLWRMMKEGD